MIDIRLPNLDYKLIELINLSVFNEESNRHIIHLFYHHFICNLFIEITCNISRRNEMVIGSKAIISKQVGAIAVQGDDPKKFAAAMVEYNRQKELGSPPGKGVAAKSHARKRNKMKVSRLSSY